MKRLLFTTLFSMLLLPLFSIMIQAAPTTYDAFSCDINANSFSVDVLSVSGGQVLYDSRGCYLENQYSQAIEKMNELVTAGNKDVVVRYIKTDIADFYSPLKVIAASRGMAYTQNQTYFNQSTLNIHSLVTLNSAVNYIDNSEPLVYYETNVSNQSSGVYNPNNLVAYIQINGQAGYVPIKMIDIIPFIYVENLILAPYYIRVSESGSLVFYDRLNRDPGIIPEPVNYTVSNGEMSIYIDRAISGSTLLFSKAPSWLPNGKYYSPDGIHFYTDLDMKNPVLDNGAVGEFYSYFLYLNFRSKSNYYGNELNFYLNSILGSTINSSVMKDQGDAFVNSQNSYGMNALLFYAFAAHESDFGRSSIAVNKLNLFGYGAYDSDPSNAATYTSIQDGVARHMGIQMRFYLDYTNNNRFYSSNLGNKGVGLNTKYASDPYWNVKIAGHAYRIDKGLGSKDVNYYQIGILSEDSRNIYIDRSLVTPYLSINPRAKNYPVILNNIKNDIYQINTSNPIEGGALVTSSNTNAVPYNFDTSVAYIAKTQVKLVNIPIKPVTIISDTDELLVYVTNWDWQENSLYIKGWAALKSTNMATSTVTHQVKIINMDDNTSEIRDLSIATQDYELNIGNSYDYTNAWFDGVIDVSTLVNGNFRFEIITKSGDTTGTLNLFNSTIDAPRTETRIIENVLYRSSFNNTRGMRFELTKENGLNVPDITPILPSRFNSSAYITNFAVATNEENKELLNVTGLAFMQGVPTGAEDNVTHSLLLLNNEGIMIEYPLTTNTGIYDISNNGINYSYAWFYGVDINITDLVDGQYKLFVITSTTLYKDVIEVRDILVQNDQVFTSTNQIYTLKTNTEVRRRYSLIKE